MRKLLELDQKALLSGRSRGKFMPGGIWDVAQGINPFLENDTYRGMVAMTNTPTDKTGSVVVDAPIAYTKDELGSTYNLYMLGLSGHFYKVTPTEVVSDLRSGTPINSPANGMGIFQPVGGSPVLLFARQTRIGTWDLSGTYATGWNDTAYDPGTTTPHRPFHRLFDRLYYGNKNYVGQFADDGSMGITHTAQALDIDPQETVTTLSDDGRYLVITASRVVQESYTGFNSTRVLFWDAGKQRFVVGLETSVHNEASIRGAWREGNIVYLVGERGLYTVAFGQAPQMVLSFDSDESIAFDALNYGHVQSVGTWGDGVIFGKLGTAFAKFLPGLDRISYNPLQGFTGDIGLIIPDFIQNKVYVGTRTPKLYAFDMTSAGSASGNAFGTHYLDLGAYCHVQRLDLDLPNGAGDMTISVSGTDSIANSVSLTINATKYPSQRKVSIYFNRNITDSKVKLGFLFNSGSPSFSALSLWGESANS